MNIHVSWIEILISHVGANFRAIRRCQPIGTSIEGIRQLNYDLTLYEGADRAIKDMKEICIFPDTCSE